MEGFINSATNLLNTLQLPANILAALAFLVGFYLIMVGGEEGRRKAKWWFLGPAIGLVGVNGCVALANTISTNITF